MVSYRATLSPLKGHWGTGLRESGRVGWLACTVAPKRGGGLYRIDSWVSNLNQSLGSASYIVGALIVA